MDLQVAIDHTWTYLFAHGRTFRTVTTPKGNKYDEGYTRADVETMVNTFVPVVVGMIAVEHDWPFTHKTGTKSTTANVSEYTLEGDNNDCGDIMGIRYGTGNGIVLNELNVLDTDRKLSSNDTAVDSTVYGFVKFGRSDEGFPNIKLYGTPETVETLTYRYRRNNISLVDIPNNFAFVVRDGLLAQFDVALTPIFKGSLAKMASEYEIGGDGYSKMRLDPVISGGNIRRGGLQGGC
jgi:hypothetical protein